MEHFFVNYTPSGGINNATCRSIVRGDISYEHLINYITHFVDDNCKSTTVFYDDLKQSCMLHEDIPSINDDQPRIYESLSESSDNDPNYKLYWSIRDMLTTAYIRSLPDIAAKTYPFDLLKIFNDNLIAMIAEYNKQFGTTFGPHDSVVVYKGGNIINIHIRYLKNCLINAGCDNDIFDGAMEDIKRGDWDYSLIVSDPQLETVSRTTVLLTMQQIKKFLDENNPFDYNKIADILFKDLQVSMPDIIARYVHHNARLGKDVRVELSSIHVANSLLRRFVNKKIPSIDTPVHSSSCTIIKSDANNSFEVNSLVQAPDESTTDMKKTNVYIGFIRGITGISEMAVSDFDLARIKYNNRCTLYINGEHTIKNLSSDIVDMSFTNAWDTKSDMTKNNAQGMCVGSTRVVNQVFSYVSVNNVQLPFLTPMYILADLEQMILYDSLFPWQDKKYEKRVFRYIVMGMLTHLTLYPNVDYKALIDIINKFVLVFSKLDITAPLSTKTKPIFPPDYPWFLKKLHLNVYRTHCLYVIIQDIRSGVAPNQVAVAYLSTILTNIPDVTKITPEASINSDVFKAYITTVSKLLTTQKVYLNRLNQHPKVIADYDITHDIM
jgi:hypothetical protein